jgi:hypothetical protein
MTNDFIHSHHLLSFGRAILTALVCALFEEALQYRQRGFQAVGEIVQAVAIADLRGTAVLDEGIDIGG